ncbi:MAG: OB-fold nucleic acid binding domain-containing protein [Methanocellales archaeon]
MNLLEIYEKLEGISLEEFNKRVAEKIELLGGLCDEITAALLVAHDLGYDNTVKIAEITEEKKRITLSGYVKNIFEGREFNRENGSIGRVVNIIVQDETGSIKVALWDEYADLVKTGELKVGSRIRVNGYVKKGTLGIEVSVGRNGSLEIIKLQQEVEKLKIAQIKPGMLGVNLTAKILEITPVKTFQRRDGKEGKLASLTLGDETGKAYLTLWNDVATEVENLKIGDVIEIKNVYSKEKYGRIELYLGRGGEIHKVSTDVNYSENITLLSEIEANKSYNIEGEIVNIELPREFTRRDGSKGRVLNIKIKDKSGEAIRVALWMDKIDEFLKLKPKVGCKVKILDCYAKAGFNGEIELNAGKRSKILSAN